MELGVVLPKLAVLAANNNHQSNEVHRREVALQMFEAYSALSCCFMSDALIADQMLPGLRCLHSDVQEVAPDHTHIVESMIRELSEKVDSVRITDSLSGASQGATNTGEAMKTKMLSRFKDVTSRFGSKK